MGTTSPHTVKLKIIKERLLTLYTSTKKPFKTFNFDFIVPAKQEILQTYKVQLNTLKDYS